MIWYVLCTWCGLLIGLLVGRHWGAESTAKAPQPIPKGDYVRPKGPAAPPPPPKARMVPGRYP